MTRWNPGVANPDGYTPKRGPRGFWETMTEDQRNEYTRTINHVRELAAMGKLQRGWQTRIAAKIDYTTAAISQVYTGSFVSPPVLAQVYPYVLEETGMTEPYFLPEKVELASKLMEELDVQIEVAKKERKEAGWRHQEETIMLQQRQERAIQGFDARISVLESSHDAARARWEVLEMARQEEEHRLRFG